ncbi:MAG: hypothetical protein ACFN1F_09430, partial [Segatella sp.]
MTRCFDAGCNAPAGQWCWQSFYSYRLSCVVFGIWVILLSANFLLLEYDLKVCFSSMDGYKAIL